MNATAWDGNSRSGILGIPWVGVLGLVAVVGCGGSGGGGAKDSGEGRGDASRMDGQGSGDRLSWTRDAVSGDTPTKTDTRADGLDRDSLLPLSDAWTGGADAPVGNGNELVDAAAASDSPVIFPLAEAGVDLGGVHEDAFRIGGGDADVSGTGGASGSGDAGVGGASGTVISAAASSAGASGAGCMGGGGGTTGTAGGVGGTVGSSTGSSGGLGGATGLCNVGYHNGGDGQCVLIGSCAIGYHVDGFGTCEANSDGGIFVDAAMDAPADAAEDTGQDASEDSLPSYGEPRAAVAPASLDFGTLVEGWNSESQLLEVRNVGTGTLTIQSVELETGSSEQIHLAEFTPLPCLRMPTDSPFTIGVNVQGLAAGTVTGTVLIKTDSIDGVTLRVPVTAVVRTCAQYCPISHGTGTCAAQTCAISACDSGWHNLDSDLTNGCECQEEDSGHDISGTCTGGKDLGTVSDCNSPHEVTYSANLHSAEDIDLYYVRTEDASSLSCDLLSDSSRIRVQLDSGPPGLAVCVMVRGWSDGCANYQSYFNPDNCWTSDARPWKVYDPAGSWGSDDSHTVVVQVLWYPGAAPVCQSYSIRIRGKD